MSDVDVSATSGGGEEDLKKYGGPQGCYLRWRKELDLVRNSKERQRFERNGEKINKIYLNETSLDNFGSAASLPLSRIMYNVLWANVQVLEPCLYARMPQVVVERRFKDTDPDGRLAAEIAERATDFALRTQQDRYNYAMSQAVQDRLLPGRGVVRVRYDAEFNEAKDEHGEPIVDPKTGQAIRTPKPNSERVLVDYVYWEDYFESPSRNKL